MTQIIVVSNWDLWCEVPGPLSLPKWRHSFAGYTQRVTCYWKTYRFLSSRSHLLKKWVLGWLRSILMGFHVPEAHIFPSSCILKGNWCYIMFSWWLSALSQQCSRSREKRKCRIIETQGWGQYSLLSRLFFKHIFSVFSKLYNKTKLKMDYLLAFSSCVCGGCVCCVYTEFWGQAFFHYPALYFLGQGLLTEIEAHQFV